MNRDGSGDGFAGEVSDSSKKPKAPPQAAPRRQGREIYKDAAGNRVPSVTTIISRFKESGGLLFWANQAGLDGQTLDEARRPAATAGTLAHELVEAHLNQRTVPDMTGDEEVGAKARAAFATYVQWHAMTKLRVRHTEVSLVSERHKFGGRLDAVGEVGGKLVLVDWKTGGVYADHLLQLAGYKILWEENYPDHPITGGVHLCSFKRETADFSHNYFSDLCRHEGPIQQGQGHRKADEVNGLVQRIYPQTVPPALRRQVGAGINGLLGVDCSKAQGIRADPCKERRAITACAPGLLGALPRPHPRRDARPALVR